MTYEGWKSYLNKDERKLLAKLEKEIKERQKEKRALMFRTIDRARRLQGRKVPL